MTVDGNPIRTAIRQKLLTSTGLTNLLSEPDAVYYQLGPSGAELPYVVFQEQADGAPLWTMEGPPLETVAWLVKATGTVEEAENIHIEIRKALDRAELTIQGHDSLYCQRQSSVAYPETDNGQRFQHVGSIYRITTKEQ